MRCSSADLKIPLTPSSCPRGSLYSLFYWSPLALEVVLLVWISTRQLELVTFCSSHLGPRQLHILAISTNKRMQCSALTLPCPPITGSSSQTAAFTIPWKDACFVYMQVTQEITLSSPNIYLFALVPWVGLQLLPPQQTAWNWDALSPSCRLFALSSTMLMMSDSLELPTLGPGLGQGHSIPLPPPTRKKSNYLFLLDELKLSTSMSPLPILFLPWNSLRGGALRVVREPWANV